MQKSKKGYRRGYAVAVLVGIEESSAVLWKVFSNVVKHEKNIPSGGTRSDSKALYNFHESIISALRPSLKEGVRSIILASPTRTSYAQDFTAHVRAHHAWLTQGSSKATFSQITGSADTLPNVTALVRRPEFKQIIGEAALEETESIIDLLEKRLNTQSRESLVLYSLEEIEDLVYSPSSDTTGKGAKTKPEYLVLTNKYLSESRQKNRLHRLIQIAANKHIKTRIIDADSPAGKRITQLGGIVSLARISS